MRKFEQLIRWPFKERADLKPLLIDLDGEYTPTGRKQEFHSVQRERLSEEALIHMSDAIVQRTARTYLKLAV